MGGMTHVPKALTVPPFTPFLECCGYPCAGCLRPAQLGASITWA